jgi:hypothetical protein
MLFATVASLTALLCIVGSIVFTIQDPDPIKPIALVSLCALSFALGMMAHRVITGWEQRFGRSSDDADSYTGE